LAPKYLGVKAVIAKSFARIHMANLVNFGILPLTLIDKHDYSGFSLGDMLDLDVKDLKERLFLKNLTKSLRVEVALSLSEFERGIVKAGGKLAAIRAKQNLEQL
jgi:aconitate hydratase